MKRGIELLERPCPRDGGQLVRIIGCACGCEPVTFCAGRGCTWQDPAKDYLPERTTP